MTIKRRLAVVGIIMSIIAGFVSGLAVVGSEARLPDVLTLFFSGFAGGASLVAFISKKKNKLT